MSSPHATASMSAILRLLLLLPVVWLAADAAAVEVIVHPSVGETSMSVANAKSIFSMKQTRWRDGGQIRVFVLPDGHPAHGEFTKKILNLYPYQLRQIWDRQVYSGIGQAPQEVSTEEEMLSRVATTPGAIGYLSKPNVTHQVRILSVQ